MYLVETIMLNSMHRYAAMPSEWSKVTVKVCAVTDGYVSGRFRLWGLGMHQAFSDLSGGPVFRDVKVG